MCLTPIVLIYSNAISIFTLLKLFFSIQFIIGLNTSIGSSLERRPDILISPCWDNSILGDQDV